MFGNTSADTNGINHFQSEIEPHKVNCCNNGNSLLASATASISSHNSANRTSPSGVSQHRISIHVKVEENSISSTEDNNSNGNGECNALNNDNSANNWSAACVYRCNITADSRRYVYNNNNNSINEDNNNNSKCMDGDIDDKAQLETENNHLLALREQFLCPASAFSTNVGPQQNNQLYSDTLVGTNCIAKNNQMRDDTLGSLLSNTNAVVSNNEEKAILMPSDPIYWNCDHVRHWLEWMVKKYALHDCDINRFTHFVGRDLCRMTREDFNKLTDSSNGEVFHAQLQLLRQSSSLNVSKEKHCSITNLTNSWKSQESNNKTYTQNVNHNSGNTASSFRVPKSETSYKGAWGSPSPSPSQGYHHNALTGMTKSSPLDAHSHPHFRNMQDPYQMFGPTSSRLASSGSGQIQLWQFLLELLSDSGNANCITWEGTNGEFKLSDPDEVARRWGERKSKPNMNYDKLSRALRYYYDKNIMTKVHGKRYAYKFDFQGLAQATQPTAADPTAYKAAYQSADLFMHPPHGYPHPGSAAKHLNFAAAVHGSGISPSTSGGIFPSATSYWSPGAAANLYSNIAAASASHHATMPHHHHPGHVASHIGSYAHYA